MRVLAAISLIAPCLALAGGCSGGIATRDFGISYARPQEVVFDGVGKIEFNLVNQRDDYLRVVFTIENTCGKTLRFKPMDANTKAWGVVLVPDRAATITHQSGAPESGLVVPPGKKVGVELTWGILNSEPGFDWAWTLEIHGLMRGETEVPTFTIDMPSDQAEYRMDNGKGRQ